MNNTETYLLPPINSSPTPPMKSSWLDCDETCSLSCASSGLTPADVYPWWNSAEPLRKKKRKHKKRAERELQYLLTTQAIGATAERKWAQKEQRKQAKRELQYRLIERSIDATVDTVNAITKMYVSRQLNPYRE